MENRTAGIKIKKLRERKAWTQEHLAEAAQISPRTVQRAEDGTMSAETATALAGALDEPIETILEAETRMPDIVPIVYYDHASSLDWLVKAFGFELGEKMLGPNSTIMHAELSYGDGLIMVGAPIPERTWKTPMESSGVLMQSVMVMVDDVMTHCETARASGATILVEPEESYGIQRYRVEDCEGHVWTFARQTGAI